MTSKQVDLLMRLINAERLYFNEMLRGKGNMAERRLRGVEVGRISGISHRTANSLVEAGLCYTIADGDLSQQTWLYLKESYDDER